MYAPVSLVLDCGKLAHPDLYFSSDSHFVNTLTCLLPIWFNVQTSLLTCRKNHALFLIFTFCSVWIHMHWALWDTQVLIMLAVFICQMPNDSWTYYIRLHTLAVSVISGDFCHRVICYLRGAAGIRTLVRYQWCSWYKILCVISVM